MQSVDLDTLEYRRRVQSPEFRRQGRPRSLQGRRELTVSDLATELVRTELWLRPRGRSLLGQATAIGLVESRARAAGLRRWHGGEVESALIWLCTRGLCECEGVTYHWTSNATDARLGRLLA